ncbi:hypothetical protein IHC92_05595 [Photobacterium damselae subsp. damselae]|uniref:hypothetical protein n=1 Tax=Photobacterium damselae TaxID=38293 RepID=UPI001F418BEC|nr:hypothetical protein [Photobacterium damselae]UKA07255.1 hypothetical protein IHC90_05595 [Photobacterium damselae subsp. damselae]UKA22361.1 hypothetical protein IHC92_05595 [Photobacterium damselae subsp. damselae]
MSSEWTLIIVFGGVAALVVSKINEFVLKKFFNKNDSLEERIELLTKELQCSSKLISEIEKEISSRQQLVLELEKDAEQYRNLASINKEQAKALIQESNKSFWLNFVQSTLFFILGLIIPRFF